VRHPDKPRRSERQEIAVYDGGTLVGTVIERADGNFDV
jgi:hypothetical protein